MGNAAVIRMAHDDRGVTLADKPMAFLVTGEHTRHTSMFEWTLPPGFSTGRHVHRVQEETFYVLEGVCDWQIGAERIDARPGTFVFIPPGVPHNIANNSDRVARVLMTVSPPGHEHYFEELAQIASAGAMLDSTIVGNLRRRYDTDQLSALQAAD
jgi:quercetin dioxygenase-like cupin family protein